MEEPLENSHNSDITLSTYQTEVEKTDESKKKMVSLLGLVGEIGDLHSLFKKKTIHSYPTFKRELAEEIGDVLWYLSSLATRHDLSLQEIAEENLRKAQLLFHAGDKDNFDEAYPEDERFPRKFSVVFQEKNVGKAVQVKIKINDVFVGDALDDNAYGDDGYRFHDVFHFSYAAILGWSPVTRALLRRKRKSREAVDRIEDGARAIFLEEAIAVFVFNQAPDRDYFKEINSIDIGLLKTIKKLTSNLEVKRCSAKQWQVAIFQGYKMFHLLKANHGGIIDLDLDTRVITYRALDVEAVGVENV